MLLRDDVLNVVRETGLLLAKEAVFAAVTGSRADGTAQSLSPSALAVGMQIPSCLELENRDEVVGIDVRLILCPFGFGEKTLVGLLGEHINSFLNSGVNSEVDELSRRLRIGADG